MKNKKSQGISVNVIIIAVIALIILVVLIAIFSGKISIFGKEVTNKSGTYTGKKCKLPGSGRVCVNSENTDCIARGGNSLGRGWEDCASLNQYCCQL